MSNISPNTGVPVSSSASMGIKMTPTDWLLGKKQNYEQCIQLGLEFLGTDADFVHLEPKDRLFLAIQYANGLCQQLNNAELEKTLVRLDHSTRRDQYGESANQTTKATVARLSPLYDILRIKSDKSPTLD